MLLSLGWVELADIYRNAEEAHESVHWLFQEKGLFPQGTSDSRAGERLATAFVKTLGDKLQKSSYDCVFETYARGFSFLRREILYLPDPLLNAFKKN